MFQLSQTHHQAFQAKAEADFVSEVMQYLREKFPESIPNLANNYHKIKDFNENSLKLFCETGISISRKKGLVGKREIRTFISYMTILGVDFYEHELVRKYLLPFNKQPDNSILKLVYIAENEWAEIKKFCDSKVIR